MALISQQTGSVYPGSNAKAIYKQEDTQNNELYTVPAGRILYVSNSRNLKVNGVEMPSIATGGSTSTQWRAPFWATQGDVISASNNGANFVGIEIDA